MMARNQLADILNTCVGAASKMQARIARDLGFTIVHDDVGDLGIDASLKSEEDFLSPQAYAADDDGRGDGNEDGADEMAG